MKLMKKQRCYLPAISRPLIAALYHEARHRNIPMTRLIDRLLEKSLRDSQGWQEASRDWPELMTKATRQDQSID